jgi:hypothetical protein
MAGYDYTIRNEVITKRDGILKDRINHANSKVKSLAKEIAALTEYSSLNESLIREVKGSFHSGNYNKPSDFFKKGMEDLLTIFVPEQYRESYLYIIDKLNEFQYTVGWSRRSLRAQSYVPWIPYMFKLLNRMGRLFLYETDLSGLLLGQVEDEHLLLYLNHEMLNQMYFMEDLIAAEIDRGNPGIRETIHEILFSENNTGRITVSLVRGIIKSSDKQLHKDLGDFLLAARLQEGVRQVVCENMDCGTTDAFLTLFQIIEDNNLIRYSAVRRAVCTWIGIFQEDVERLTDKMVALMGQCLRDEHYREEQLKTEDSVAICCSLWSKGFYDVHSAIKALEELVDHGTKHQKMTASYYNNWLQLVEFQEKAAIKVLREDSVDLELAACYMPSFLMNVKYKVRELVSPGFDFSGKVIKPRSCKVKNYFVNQEEAVFFYEKLKEIYNLIPKKGVQYSPCIFPWYSVSLTKSDVGNKLCFLAYMIQDETLLDEACSMIPELSDMRSSMTRLLLYEPKNDYQRSCLVSLLSNAESDTSDSAYKLLELQKLDKENYKTLETMMKSKRGEIRTRVSTLLLKQDEEYLKGSLERLVSAKDEQSRTGALDMIMELRKKPENKKLYESVKVMAETIDNPTGKEKVLIDQILGHDTEGTDILSMKGYGIYNPDVPLPLKKPKADRKECQKLLSLEEKEIREILEKLDGLIDENKLVEYRDAWGETCLIGNRLTFSRLPDRGQQTQDLSHLPLTEVWENFYKNQIGSFQKLIQIDQYNSCFENLSDYEYDKSIIKSVFKVGLLKTMPYELKPLDLKYSNQINFLLHILINTYKDRMAWLSMATTLAGVLIEVLKEMKPSARFMTTRYNSRYPMTNHPIFNMIIRGLNVWETDEEFETVFQLKWNLEELYVAPQNEARYGEGREISLFYFMKACLLGLIEKDILYKAIFEWYDMKRTFSAFSQIMMDDEEVRGVMRNWELRQVYGDAVLEDLAEEHEGITMAQAREISPVLKLGEEIYLEIIPKILEVELRRGDKDTVFSPYIKSINCIYGTDLLIRILTALGNDTLERTSYYYGSASTKKASMSHLLSVVYPNKDENADTLCQLLKGTDIRDKRLIEVAMFAPQWIDMIEAYLGWNGLKSGCYYFMAHMNERFDDKKKAMIAKYTPLNERELQDGAFDINWFKEAYGKLGEKNFMELYDAAKYITYGTVHARARKYADAALGKVTEEQIRTQVSDKRNKDLLMSYGLIPLDSKDQEGDILKRYQYLQQFLKESKQFGAQRRSSEGRAVEIAMQNLSINAGFQDVMRLTLRMETRLAESMGDYFQWNPVDDVEVKIHVAEDGTSRILCRKAGKELKSVPSRLKKQEMIVDLTAANKKLKAQYTRTKQMMEQAMEDRTSFTVEEITMLYGNPVAKPVIWNLVYVHEDHLGFLRDGVLVDYAGNPYKVSPTDSLYVAHPTDFYKSGVWHEYQKYLFDQEIRQPFKQVFRELYVKTEEELLKHHSLAFAGNQIQPQKTVGVLRGRRWVADYEDGLQKVYYKDNIIARIYALADWFSPADAEAPTLEWVEFSDRKDFHSLKIQEIPDIIYSEVMRDVDLAVSVAHVGGVDPETSHSTIDIRRTIIEFNLPLFKLNNVTFNGNHAVIKGTRGEYSVHLGSGIIHQIGGSMIAVLPVHSQKRGKLFLPFIDEDPKTAEIMSKIILFAEDQKIKDPYILDQII